MSAGGGIFGSYGTNLGLGTYFKILCQLVVAFSGTYGASLGLGHPYSHAPVLVRKPNADP